MAEEGLQLKRYGELAELVLARPERQNAINRAMWQALARHCDEMERDPALRVVVVRGEGAAFSAGADIAEFEQVFADRHTAHDYNELVQQAIGRLERLGKPTIAAIGGTCVGGGCALAAACDLRFAAADARLGITPARLGLGYSLGDVRRLMALVGPARAKDLLYSARLVGAEEARALGLVDRVVPTAELVAVTVEYARSLVALSGNTQAIIKRMARLVLDGVTEETPESRALRDAAVEHPDFAEGREAFLRKRRARFGQSRRNA
jgi:enoyl-CoA hydratase/carnithine racemase